MSEEIGPQITVGRVFVEASTKDHKISVALEGLVEVSLNSLEFVGTLDLPIRGQRLKFYLYPSRFSDTGTCTRELQKALDCMLVVLKCVNDSMHQIAITGFPVSSISFQMNPAISKGIDFYTKIFPQADLSQQGDLLLQDSFQLWTESKKDIRLRLKTQHRHIFLYQKAMLFCKQGSKTGHNKSTYQFKHWLKVRMKIEGSCFIYYNFV